MSIPERILQVLDPPSGGWPRLIRRRDAGSSWLMPFGAVSSAIAVVVFVFPWAHRQPLELKLNGARLLDERSQGMSLRMLDSQRLVALPSSDPNVSLYWIELGNKAQGSDNQFQGSDNQVQGSDNQVQGSDNQERRR